jgi:hypothetical protein
MYLSKKWKYAGIAATPLAFGMSEVSMPEKRRLAAV